MSQIQGGGGGGGGVTAVTGTAPITSSGGATPAISLDDTIVTPGAYTLSGFTVDAKGRLTAAATGSLTGPITSTGLATVVAAQTGTGSVFVMQASPILTTPNIGTPSAGVLTSCTGLPTAGLVDAAVTYAKIQNVTTARLLGRATALDGVMEEITLGTNLSFTGTTLNATGGGGASLDAITAAASDQAGIANADWNIVWNWAKITNSESAFTFGETTAATGGTSTSGIPNQVLLKLSTLATSTMSPLSIYVRGVHTLSISPSAQQLLAADDANGGGAQPIYSFASSTNTGMYKSGGNLAFKAANATSFQISNTTAMAGNGSMAAPGLSFAGATTTGLSFANPGIGFSIVAKEEARMIAGIFQPSHGSADAVSYAINARKSRGTVAAPTVITTGDAGLTDSAFYYLGATNTYEEASRITHVSTGTIADTPSGVGGKILFGHAIVGTVGIVTVATIRDQHVIHSGTAPTITAGGGTTPSIVGTDESFVVTIGTGGVATTVEVTFGNAFTTNPPAVSVVSDTDIVPFKITPLTNKVTITATAAFTAGSKLYCIARGWE